MVEEPTDQHLVNLVQQGNKRAFDVLVKKYQYKIIKLVARYVRDPNEVMDVSQEAFIKAYRALADFRGESAFYTWLYRIAINTAKNYAVARNRRPPDCDVDVIDAEILEGGRALRELDTPERLLLRDEIKDVVFGTIEKLPEDLRTAIILREIDGLSYEDIAKVMECPVGTVRSRIFRAREAIEKRVKPLLEKT